MNYSFVFMLLEFATAYLAVFLFCMKERTSHFFVFVDLMCACSFLFGIAVNNFTLPNVQHRFYNNPNSAEKSNGSIATPPEANKWKMAVAAQIRNHKAPHRPSP